MCKKPTSKKLFLFILVIIFHLSFSRRLGIPVDTMKHMVGSYAPKLEPHAFQTPPEDAPSGTFKRGTYTVSSLFTDDDKNEHLKWEWNIEIKKDWKD